MADNNLDSHALRRVDTHIDTRSMQTLMGLVNGIVADAQLNEMELRYLRTWLTEHPRLLSQWPACAIASWIHDICEDGIVTQAELEYVLGNLQQLASSDFASTGSTSAEPLRLPIDDSEPVNFQGATTVLTGEFMYGTRRRCEDLCIVLGSIVAPNVTKKTNVLVIGHRVSASWQHESYGAKIARAAELRSSGSPIRIISEQFWFATARAVGKC
jgi:NAD-dependent DNA ligase